MHEFSVPVAYVVKPDDNVTDDVFTNAENWPETVGLKRRVGGTWVPVTWREFAEQVCETAAGFITAGIRPGDRVGLMSRTRYEWALLDYAILAAGGVTVPIYPTSSLEQIEWILGDSGAVAVVVETDDHAEKIATARASLPALMQVWEIEGGWFGGLSDLRARGAQVTPEQVKKRRRTRGADDLAEIVYTSGTTGRLKGCMLSHGNIVANARNCMENDGFRRVSTRTIRRCCSCRSRTAMPRLSCTALSTRVPF
jgi:long-chain acyl-CoA synthetase